MRYLVNPFRRPATPLAVPPTGVRGFHRTLPGYRPTPLRDLPGLARELGIGRLLLKDEGARLDLAAFKVLGVSWAIERLLRDGMSATTLSSATAGNHGRALAWAARQRGLRAIVFIPANSAPARVQAIRGEGAEVVPVDGSYEDAVDRCAVDSAAGGWQVVADVGYPGYMEIPSWISEGYGTIFEEVAEDLAVSGDPPPDMVVVQGGVGGLAAAVVPHAARWSPPARVLVVEPEEADCLLASASAPDGVPTESRGTGQTVLAGLNCARVSLAAWPTIRAGAEAFLSVSDELALQALRRLATPRELDPRVVAGASGAAGVAGLMALTQPAFAELRRNLALDERSRILVVSTEGATDPAHWSRVVGVAP